MDTTSVTYAGFWKRFAAHLVDSFIIGVCSMIIILPVVIMMGIGFGASAIDMEGSEEMIPVLIALLGAYLLVVLIAVILTWLYYALMESSSKQGTLGKMILGIVVTDMNGGRITFGRATARYFSKILSGLIFGIGYIMAGFTEKKQALHDMIAGCLVVNKPYVLPPSSNQQSLELQ